MSFSLVHTADFHLDRNFSFLPDENPIKEGRICLILLNRLLTSPLKINQMFY